MCSLPETRARGSAWGGSALPFFVPSRPADQAKESMDVCLTAWPALPKTGGRHRTACSRSVRLAAWGLSRLTRAGRSIEGSCCGPATRRPCWLPGFSAGMATALTLVATAIPCSLDGSHAPGVGSRAEGCSGPCPAPPLFSVFRRLVYRGGRPVSETEQGASAKEPAENPSATG